MFEQLESSTLNVGAARLAQFERWSGSAAQMKMFEELRSSSWTLEQLGSSD